MKTFAYLETNKLSSICYVLSSVCLPICPSANLQRAHTCLSVPPVVKVKTGLSLCYMMTHEAKHHPILLSSSSTHPHYATGGLFFRQVLVPQTYFTHTVRSCEHLVKTDVVYLMVKSVLPHTYIISMAAASGLDLLSHTKYTEGLCLRRFDVFTPRAKFESNSLFDYQRGQLGFSIFLVYCFSPLWTLLLTSINHEWT